MDNQEKAEIITRWINPEERVTVDFVDEKDLNAELTRCSPELVDISLETAFPHLKQTVSVPLGDVELFEDRTRYTRDPDTPLQHSRLRLFINRPRPQVV